VTLACPEDDDALFGRPSRQQPRHVLVEAVRTSEIANAEGDSRDTRFHPDSSQQPAVTQVSRAGTKHPVRGAPSSAILSAGTGPERRLGFVNQSSIRHGECRRRDGERSATALRGREIMVP
jgi:hypothetical protein